MAKRTIKDPPPGGKIPVEDIRAAVLRVKEDRERKTKEVGLTRTMGVFTFDHLTAADEPGGLYFVQRDEDAPTADDDSRRPVIQLPPEMWRDMGNPEAITIAIWPGDRQDLLEQEDFPA